MEKSRLKTMDISDEELIVHFQEGDERSFDELVRRYERKIRALCLHYLSDATEAEDSAQETFIKAYSGLKRFQPQARFSTWLYRIAINHCLNVLRARRRRQWLQPLSQLLGSGEKRSTPLRAASDDPLQQMQRQEKMAQVHAALAQLPAEQRSAVILHRFEGLSYQQIAEVMGCSVAAVEARLHRAKRNLIKLLGEYFEQSP